MFVFLLRKVDKSHSLLFDNKELISSWSFISSWLYPRAD